MNAKDFGAFLARTRKACGLTVPFCEFLLIVMN